MAISPLSTPIPARNQSQEQFDANYAAYLIWQTTIANEINATVALLNAGAGMGAYAIPYTFSTTPTDDDPGNGNLRLNQATQNTATVIRADLLDSGGTTQTAVLDSFTSTAGTIKGYIRLVKVSDATKWLFFSVSAVATPAGYRNITVANIGSSEASPFANGDAIMLYFTPLNTVNNSVGDHEVTVHTGNGHGSTNTKIRRFTTALVNTGTAITYADSATLGGSFTINETGIYAIHYKDGNDAGNAIPGLSVNSTQLTTEVTAIAVADRLDFIISSGAGAGAKTVSITKRFAAGDVIRAHSGSGLPGATETNHYKFTIVKVGF